MAVPESQREFCRQLGYAKRTHGEGGPNGTVEYGLWGRMLRRCYNPNSKEFRYYGGRGITVDERWRTSYPNFLHDLGRRPSPAHSLERIDNSGNYEPGNVKWATKTEQARNTRRNRLITYNRITHCVAEWAELLGISYTALWQRLEAPDRWTIERALTTPVRTTKMTDKKESN